MTNIQMNTIAVNDPVDRVIAVLGEPLKQTIQSETNTIYTYSSTVPSLSDYVYLKENTVILISQSLFEEKKKLSEQLPKIGEAEAIYERKSSTRSTASSTYLYTWYSKGMATEMTSNLPDARIVRLLRFLPMDEQQFFSLWPSSSSLIKINMATTTSIERENLFSSQRVNNSIPWRNLGLGMIGMATIAVLVLVIANLRIKKIHKLK